MNPQSTSAQSNMATSKNCQNCKNSLIIDADDQSFYEKMKVPHPTFCPSCSHQRRFAWRNTHSLYRRNDSVSGKSLISIYHPDTKMNIVDQKYWWSDEWDPMDYGKKYDFNKNFFSQWAQLRDVVPFQALSNSKAINSEYCNVAEESYDCYLISACWKNERCLYADSLIEVKDSMDLYIAQNCEFCYEDVYCSSSYKLFYSEHCTSCADSYFLYDCKGCTDCFMSSNLRNKSYVFENIQYSKDEYFKKLGEYNLGNFKTIENLKKQFKILRLNSIHKYANLLKCQNVTGDNTSNAFNSKYIFDGSNNIKDSKYLFWVTNNVFDCYYCNAVGTLQNSFESCDGGVGGNNCKFTNVVYSSSNVEYSFNCYNCHDLFGCIGLRNKSYCILNTQYTKEQYYELLPKIKQHMNDMPYIDKRGIVYKYGEFFPIELSPFAYNETIANNFYPLSEEEIIENGFLYRKKEQKNYDITLESGDMVDDIKEIDNYILNQIIQCDAYDNSDRCTSAFKIIEKELEFYKRFNIPLPRSCYQCRHKMRFDQRLPLKLYPRTCMCKEVNHAHGDKKCEIEFETSYAPDRPEIVYCEKCYQQEVL